MPETSYEGARRDIEAGQVCPLYLFHGEETFLADDLLARLRARLLPGGLDELNHERLYADEITPETLLTAVRTLPFMSGCRLVLVRRAEALPRGGEALADYFEDPVSSTCLVLLADALPRQSQLPHRVKKKGTVVSLSSLKPAAFRKHLSSLAREKGLRFDSDALDLLAERAGRNLHRGIAEMEKLSVWETKAGRVDRELVAAVVDDGRLDTFFDLADALGRKQLARALEALHRLRGIPPLVLLATVGRHFRRLFELRAKLDVEGRKGEGTTQGKQDYYLKKMTRQASLFSAQEIRGVFQQLHSTDLALKGTSTPNRLVLEDLVFAICGSAKGKDSGEDVRGKPGEASGRRPAC